MRPIAIDGGANRRAVVVGNNGGTIEADGMMEVESGVVNGFGFGFGYGNGYDNGYGGGTWLYQHAQLFGCLIFPKIYHMYPFCIQRGKKGTKYMAGFNTDSYVCRMTWPMADELSNFTQGQDWNAPTSCAKVFVSRYSIFFAIIIFQ